MSGDIREAADRLQAAEAALRHGDGQCEREAGDWRDEEQAGEPTDSRQIHRDVPPAKGGTTATEVLEVFVAAMREVERDHPDEVHDHLGAERDPDADSAEETEDDGENQQARPREPERRVTVGVPVAVPDGP